MHHDHKVVNDEVCLKLKRVVAPSGFKLPKARKDDAICDVRVLEEIHIHILWRYSTSISISRKNRTCGFLAYLFHSRQFWILIKNYRAVAPKR